MRSRAIAVAMALGLVVWAVDGASAQPFDWKDCKIELEKFCQGVSGDDKIWACLEKHDEKLSKKCDQSHGKYEEITGRKKK